MKTTFYLINLDGSTDRLHSASRQLHAEAVDFIRVPAFDGRGKEVSEFKDYDAKAAIAYMGTPARRRDRLLLQPLEVHQPVPCQQR